MSASPVLALTEDIYDAAVGGTPWEVVGRCLSRLVRASSAWISVSKPHGADAELLYRAHFPDDEIAAYRDRLRHIDLWTTRTIRAVMRGGAHVLPKATFSGHLVSDAEYLRSEYYAVQGRRLGLRHCMGTVIPLGPGELMPVGLHRPDGADPFGAEEARLLNVLLPHLRRAIALRQRLDPGADAPPGLAALDALAAAVVVVDGEARVILANVAAEKLATADAGVRIVRAKTGARSCGSTLMALHRAEGDRLDTLIRATACGTSPGGVVRLSDGALRVAVAAVVSPLPKRLAGASGVGRVAGQALVFLRDLTPSPPAEPRLLRELFGLTATEAEVACALHGGATKAAVAARRGLRESTIRSQVDAILAKTGAVNLRDLERLLTSLR